MYGSLVLRPDQESAVWLWVGPPRSGKTYHAVLCILGWVRRGGRVVTNIPFTSPVQGVTVVSDEKLSPSQLCQTVEEVRCACRGTGVLVVVDEASIHWDSREWTKVSAEVRGWLATVGHRGVSVVVIGQSVSMVDATMRRLARFLVEHKDGTGGILGLFTSDVRQWVLYEGVDESWVTVRERGWFVVGPGLPYKSADFYRGNVVSGFGARFAGLLVLFVLLYFGAVYGARYAVVIYGKVRGVGSSFGGSSAVSYQDPFASVVRVCGVVEDGALVEDGEGRCWVLPVKVSDDVVGQKISLRELLAKGSKSREIADVKEKK